MTNKVSIPKRGIDRVQRTLLVMMLILTCVGCIILVTVVPLLYLWSARHEMVVTEVRNAGQVQSVSLASGMWTRSLVETDKGYFSLVDAVSINKQEQVTLEIRGNRSRFLCDREQRCTKLISSNIGG